MPASYDELIALRRDGLRFAYGERETMLYALSVGMGCDPLDARELPFVYEGAGLRAMPTQSCVVARSNLLEDTGLDRTRIVHGEQRLTLHQPLPAAAELVANTWVEAVVDKGAGKGALVVVGTDLMLAGSSDTPLCTLMSTIFARGDGGIGGPSLSVEPPVPVPSRGPDHVVSYQTSPNQALFYRLNGDRNPLHASPDFAARGGFSAPILHGLCTFGVACRAVLATACQYEPTSILSYGARFTRPVFPGETIDTELWVDGDQVAFRARVPDRDIVALDYGLCTLRQSPG